MKNRKAYMHQWYLKNCEKTSKQKHQRIKKKRKYVQDYKLSKGCIICGYNRCAEALGFHHDRDKEFNISKAIVSRKLEKIKEEMKKCVVICCNCHRELHEREKMFGKQVPLKSLDP